MNIAAREYPEAWHRDYFEHALPDLAYPFGWMSPVDMTVLYNAARRARGPVLEVGPFIGRSTTALAAGLRDREADGAAPVPFDTVDFGITSAEEWADRFGEPLRPGKADGKVIASVYHPGGTLAVLIANLRENGMLDRVTSIIRGDILTAPIGRRYALIFCDATHDSAEIARNVPRIAELAAPGATLVFDDIITEDHATEVAAHFATERRVMTRTLFPNRARRAKVMVLETG